LRTWSVDEVRKPRNGKMPGLVSRALRSKRNGLAHLFLKSSSRFRESNARTGPNRTLTPLNCVARVELTLV
jgi:hypothetical protein